MKEKCDACGVSEDEANDFLKIVDGFLCGDCFDDGCLPSRTDQIIYRHTGYIVERS
jgi:hypothetical protein